jgi:hypothetical protein
VAQAWSVSELLGTAAEVFEIKANAAGAAEKMPSQ